MFRPSASATNTIEMQGTFLNRPLCICVRPIYSLSAFLFSVLSKAQDPQVPLSDASEPCIPLPSGILPREADIFSHSEPPRVTFLLEGDGCMGVSHVCKISWLQNFFYYPYFILIQLLPEWEVNLTLQDF